MKKAALLFAIVLAAVAGAWLARATLNRNDTPAPVPLQYGTALPEPRPLPDFALVSHTGAPLGPADLRGRWSLMFFGFTHCPEVCPMTLALLADVRKRLGPDAPQVVLVSVDPERDTPQAMANYLRAFDASMLGITGSPAAIDAFAAALGIAHRKVPIGEDQYMVDHTAAVFAIDTQGRRAAVFSPPFDAAHLASDLRRLIQPAS